MLNCRLVSKPDLDRDINAFNISAFFVQGISHYIRILFKVHRRSIGFKFLLNQINFFGIIKLEPAVINSCADDVRITKFIPLHIICSKAMKGFD